MGKCKLSDSWLINPKYKDWQDKDPKWIKKAKCRLCVKSFDISNMEEAAVVSHMQGKKHCRLVTASSALRVTSFLAQPSVRPSPITSSELAHTPNDER